MTDTVSGVQTRGLAVAGAWVLGLIGVFQLIAWANRWYVASSFARLAADGEVGWEFAYGILEKAHQALVTGLVLLLAAAALAWFAVRARGQRWVSGRAGRASTP